jgi:tRNA(fMet)-specific endonuclease VapC
VAGLVVVDTDLVIDFLRGRGPGAALVRTLLQERRLRLTTVTGFELRMGTDFLDRRDDILRLFRSRSLPLDLSSALQAGRVSATLRAEGRNIGFADCLQAGICIRYGLAFATRNRTHFERVDDLELLEVGAS